jgi:hypothetical protein
MKDEIKKQVMLGEWLCLAIMFLPVSGHWSIAFYLTNDIHCGYHIDV